MSVSKSWQLLVAAGLVAMLVALEPSVARAQSSSKNTAEEQRALDDSIRELKGQISELRQSVMELRTEAAQYRAEAVKLRTELEAARTQLGSIAAGPAQATPAPGQQPGAELQQRLSRVEEDLQLLDSKITDQAQAKVESASKYHVRLFGFALFNLFENRGTVDNIDFPTLATPRGPLGSPDSFGGTLRQSTLGLQVFGPQVAGAKTAGDIQFDFGGGFPLIPNGATMGVARLRTATLRMDWARTSVAGGQDTLFFAPLAPTSLASVAVPALAYAGNLWSWTPQLRVERRMALSDGSDISFKAGILDSLTGQIPNVQYVRQPSAGEASGQPAYATHVSWNGKASERNMTIGVGGYYGRQNWGVDRKVDSWAAVADWDLPLGQWFALSGEFYRGRAIGGLGGATGRSVVFSSSLQDPAALVSGLNSAGGWTQLKFTPLSKLEFNAAFGEDSPFSQDIFRFAQNFSYANPLVLRNQAGFVNFIAHPRSDLMLSLEYRHLRTYDVTREIETAHHINLSMGVLF